MIPTDLDPTLYMKLLILIPMTGILGIGTWIVARLIPVHRDDR